MAEKLPARAEPGAIRARRGPLAQRAEQASLTHDPAALDFSGTIEDRDLIWQRFGAGIHNRVAARIGTLVEWWADEQRGERSAVVLGTRALVVVSPTINDAGDRAYRLRSIPLDEHSFRQKAVNERTPDRPAAGTAGPQRPGNVAPQPERNPMADRLGHRMSGFLGNLPAPAQELLQEPFRDSTQSLWADYYCIRQPVGGGFGDMKFTAWCYLASSRHVTFAHGFGYGQADLSAATAWQLTCSRADVRNPGTGLARV